MSDFACAPLTADLENKVKKLDDPDKVVHPVFVAKAESVQIWAEVGQLEFCEKLPSA
jgi:hypothetical protein